MGETGLVSPIFFVWRQAAFVLYAMRRTCYDNSIYRYSIHTRTLQRGISFFETEECMDSAPDDAGSVFCVGWLFFTHDKRDDFF